MKNKIIFISIIICILSFTACNTELRAKKGLLRATSLPQQREWLKQLALCSCMTHAFSQNDSIKRDLSITLLAQTTLYTNNKIYKIIDSMAKQAAANVEPAQVADYGGRKAMMSGCFDFYMSKQLDSLIRSFDKWRDRESIKIVKHK